MTTEIIDPCKLHAIKNQLDQLELQHDMRIVLAVESGSRAWGFASKDSDYDVRFLYLHRSDWYLSVNLESKRDVIELTADPVFDINGWDLRKALKLLKKSNPPLLEWLQSSIIYREDYGIAGKLRVMLPHFFSPTASLFHYYHMARGNYRSYLKGETVWLKKYLYTVRPLLAVQWLEKGLGPVPMLFDKLLYGVLDPGDPLLAAIESLIAEKKAGNELKQGPRIGIIGTFIESELARFEDKAHVKGTPAPDIEVLNTVFRDALSEVWG